MYYRTADIDDAKLREIQALEAELGKTLVALESQPRPADMTPEELARLRKVEETLGVVLLAYER